MIIRRLSIFLVTVLTVIFCLGGTFAVNASSDYSLTVQFDTDLGPVAGSEFKIYYAMSSDGKLYGDFADLKVEVGDLNSSENLNDLAYTLASYTESGFSEPIFEANTDALGSVAFSDLSAGIYLVTGSSAQINDILYTPKPFVIRIPGFTVDGETVSDVVAKVKYDRQVITPEPISRTVAKVWDDSDNDARPKSVTVQLLENGKVYDEVTLSSSNNWTYTWDTLASESDWQVIEVDVPDDYTVTITLDGTVFTVENKNDKHIPPTSEPDNDSDDSNKDPSQSENPSDPQNSSNLQNSSDLKTPPSSQNPPKLPQTGQLWWPVPVLIASGILLLIIGVLATYLGDNNDQA